MNSSFKGSYMERLCMKELLEYVNAVGPAIAAKWSSHRCRVRGDKDFLGAWDLAVFTADENLMLVQVKSAYRPAIIKALSRCRAGNACYLAVYEKPPAHAAVEVKLPHFWLITV